MEDMEQGVGTLLHQGFMGLAFLYKWVIWEFFFIQLIRTINLLNKIWQ